MPEPEGLNERERRAWYGFLTMQEDVRRHMNRQLVREAGLSLADYAVLSTLFHFSDGSLRVFELRERLRWEKTRLTHQISRMIARGLVERRSCAEDSRGTHVAITEEGRSMIEKATPLHVRYVHELFLDVLSPRQLDTLAAVSQTVLENLRDDPFDD
ncbi:MarR family winged helix-turn-helix transcriptional regulator [Micromonospora sp. WMMD812]|uniref:MarR family winged helix-turn-helix transcriptional regulator n=1 Tax=Micromonospora sp. WMMD812 TaxID=3015152 RepID=UPI00248A91A9|nr:MarR family winged helix-turn-helix transcriptional regulator [Micromonospora sp. WMMD812]WBB69050.1 MarR family winged helix-turn-helix transcriptional regulator [Micromonospora sp. WMMD812]